MSDSTTPSQIDILIVGGGTAGAALAGILARDTSLSIVLLEAGPDPGPLDSGRWPAEMLDARVFALTHDWDYSGFHHAAQAEHRTFPRARHIGGSGAHNGCVAVVGHRRDYDAWEEAGNPGWGWESVAPAFERAKEALRVRTPDESELTPFHAAVLAGTLAAGFPRVADLNDPDIVEGVAPAPFNIYEGVRWSSALGYLEPVRSKPNLTIVPHALVDRVVLDGDRAVAIEALVGGERRTFEAGKIVLSGGAYGSPAILLRSGIGAPGMLRDLGLSVAHALPGVGHALTDHPITGIVLDVSARLQREMDEFGASRWLPDEQVVLLARSKQCREAFDLHFPAFSHRDELTSEWRYTLSAAQFYTTSAGALTLASADPAAMPVIDHGYLTDPDMNDCNVLADGLEIALGIANQMREAGTIDAVMAPAAGLSRAELCRYVEASVRTCYHPSCSNRMGPASNPLAVVDANGQVHGLTNLYVCDASIFPIVPRANTNLPAAMVAEHLAGRIAGA